MHDSVGQLQTIYVNLDICHEPLVSKTENPKFITSRRPTSTPGKFDKV